MAYQPYQFDHHQRRRLMADAGFARDLHGIWAHPDGRRIGESVALALSDNAFCRYLKLPQPDADLTEQIDILPVTKNSA